MSLDVLLAPTTHELWGLREIITRYVSTGSPVEWDLSLLSLGVEVRPLKGWKPCCHTQVSSADPWEAPLRSCPFECDLLFSWHTPESRCVLGNGGKEGAVLHTGLPPAGKRHVEVTRLLKHTLTASMPSVKWCSLSRAGLGVAWPYGVKKLLLSLVLCVVSAGLSCLLGPHFFTHSQRAQLELILSMRSKLCVFFWNVYRAGSQHVPFLFPPTPSLSTHVESFRIRGWPRSLDVRTSRKPGFCQTYQCISCPTGLSGSSLLERPWASDPVIRGLP